MIMILRQTTAAFLVTIIFFIVIFPAATSTVCDKTCGRGKSATTVKYPFGFSAGCKIRFNCNTNPNNTEIKFQGFQVLNFTPSSILINLSANCNRLIKSISPLFGSNYAPTWSNWFLFQDCAKPANECAIPTRFLESRFNLTNCSSKSNISCFSQEKEVGDVLSYNRVNESGCKSLLSSVATINSDMNSLEFQTLELGWWLPGNCSICAENATCKPLNGTKGVRCQCVDGLEGDGFVEGEGCRRVSGCTATKYFSGNCGGNPKIGILIGGVIAGATLMASLAAFCYFIRRRSHFLKNRMSAKRLLWEAAGNSTVPLYPYKDIEKATNGFSEKQRLGTGAYGTVYAGKLHNDEWVAIKKIKNRDADSIDQVMNEIKLLSSVSHPNLVRLLGCCIEKGEHILVYEYMPNGTLCQHLQRERGQGLPWTTRLTVATETAHAIAYLHSAMNPPIYHRDIKSSNILLDYNYNSKVADFGLSRLGMIETELSHISTAPQGTPGYLDPQYHQNFHLSDKSDVYSFGVVLVEIITALKVVDFSRPHSEVNLAALAIDRIGRGCVDEIIDPFLEPHRDAWTLSSIHKVAELSFRCLAFHKDMRPSMTEVATELENIRLSAWAPLDENTCIESSAGSVCSSPYGGSERSFGGLSMKKIGLVSQRLFVPQRSTAECLSSVKEAKDSSPVSVHDHWLSEQSSPSTNSLLNNVVQ